MIICSSSRNIGAILEISTCIIVLTTFGVLLHFEILLILLCPNLTILKTNNRGGGGGGWGGFPMSHVDYKKQ